jgi:DHA2 family lincomycin resistance protein-like MFS transporter
MIIIPNQTHSLNQLPRELNPHGVSILNTALQIGAAFGSAIFIGLMGMVEKNRLAGIPNPDLYQVQSAVTSALNVAFAAALVFAVIGLVLALFIKRGNKVQARAEATETPEFIDTN